MHTRCAERLTRRGGSGEGRGKRFKYPFTNILLMDTALEEQILDRLDRIEKELVEIREHMVDVDTLLSEEEKKLLEERASSRKSI